MMLSRILCILSVIICLSQLRWMARAQTCGVFDVALIIDRSSSISAASWDQNMWFTRQLTQRFKNGATRYAIYSFSPDCRKDLSLTADNAQIASAINAMTHVGSGTNPGACFIMANADVKSSGQNPPLYVVVTDGAENAPGGDANSPERKTNGGKPQADIARSLGAQVYVIHVGDEGGAEAKNVINSMANTPSSRYVFDIATYQQLATDAFIDQLITRAYSGCLAAFCEAGFSYVDAQFAQTGNNPVTCKVFNSSVIGQSGVKSATPIATMEAEKSDGGKYRCKIPAEYSEGTYGVEFKSGEASLFTLVPLHSCAPVEEYVFPWWSLLFLLLLLPLLLLCCCAYRRQKMAFAAAPPIPVPETAKTVPAAPVAVAAVAEAPEPVADVPPASKPVKKWAAVDTSKYVWARDGGTARPMPVKWGDLGATDFGTHLEAVGQKEVFTTSADDELKMEAGAGDAHGPQGGGSSSATAGAAGAAGPSYSAQHETRTRKAWCCGFF